jgi:AcrR family transcriptional regulator
VPTRTPRTGRRPGDSGSRGAILSAARRLFALHGFNDTSMRAIAAEAGVDAALIVHFFGTKAQLLTAAVEWPFDPETAMAEVYAAGRAHVGEAFARLVVRTWDRVGERGLILALLRAATTEPEAAGLFRGFVQEQLFPPLLRRLKSSDPDVRGNLASSQVIGLGMARHVFQLEPLASMSEDAVVAWVGPTFQRYLTGRLPR